MSRRTELQKRKGRILLGLFYAAYCALYLAFYFFTDESGRDGLVSYIVAGMMWLTALFGAMWLGQNWARYLYIMLLLITLLFSVPMMFAFENVKEHWPAILTLSATLLLHAAVMFTLIYSPSIQALTTRR